MHRRRRRSLRCPRFHPHRYRPTRWGQGEMHHFHRSSHLHRRRSLEYRKSRRCPYRWGYQLGLGGRCSLRNSWSRPRLNTRRCHHLRPYDCRYHQSQNRRGLSWNHLGRSSNLARLRLSSHLRRNPRIPASRPRCRTSSVRPTRRCHTRDLLRHHLAGRSHSRWHLPNSCRFPLSLLQGTSRKFC